MPLGEHVLTDYASLRLSLKAHPMALLRSTFDALGYVKSEALATLSLARPVKVAGIVLIRQRPGSASGVIFSTIEDETGIANLIIWPKSLNAIAASCSRRACSACAASCNASKA
jgi:error-prone DNA polymerase